MRNILEKIKEARKGSKSRKFEQTWDMIINVKGLDLKKPENRLNFDLTLPEGTGKTRKTAFITDSMVSEAKKHADAVITKNEIEAYTKNKKKQKQLAESYDAFFADAALMPVIGKSFGEVFGPRGKLPKPVPPKVNIAPFIEASKRSIKVMLRESPVVYVSIGREKMDDGKIAKNAQAVFNAVKERLPKGQANMKSVLIKLTMGKPVKVEVG
jgi:large subunit ribosomal protein L1